MSSNDATPARGDVPDYTREKWRQRHKALTELCLENAERATAYARSLVALGECPTTLSTSNLDALAFRDTIDVLTAERDALAQRVRELEGAIGPNDHGPVFFYERDYYPLSNFSAFTLGRHGIRFDTSEAAYHWEKFAGSSDPRSNAIASAILHARSAHRAFKIAEHNKVYRRADWDDVKVGIMREILFAKVDQHDYVLRKLLATGDRVLIENSWRDDFWGWGPNRDGQNMLGKLWMEVRAALRATRTADAAKGGSDV